MFLSLNASSGLFITILLFSLGAVFSLISYSNDHGSNILSSVFSLAAASFGLFSSLKVLLWGRAFSFSAATFLQSFSFSFHLDFLSAIFLFIISLITILTSIYGFAYVKHYYNKYSIGVLGFFYNLFILGMVLVVTSSNAIFFIIAWELMSLASYFLVIFEHKKKENIQAGALYLIMTHIGTAFIMLVFLLLYRETGSFDFEVIKNSFETIPLFIKNLVFIFAIIGFGTKAGIIPLHNWLPRAHPAAPSHVSALMSGVMIKTGVYMFIRLFFDIFSQPELWWGLLILSIGAISSLLGVLYAISEHDIKKLLAYHSIENIGIILLGIGSAIIFLKSDLKYFAVIGMVAALYHTLNHAIFKSLLFFGAGSVISATGTRNMEKYGGLIKLMPYTAVFFLFGAMAIVALPPLNGFFSEWLTFQSLFNGFTSFGMPIQAFLIFSIIFFALTRGLAAACFVKVFGTTFLARSRSEQVKKAKENSFCFQIAMALSALLTVLFGFFSGFITSVIQKVASTVMVFDPAKSLINTSFQSVSIDRHFTEISLPGVFLLIFLVTTITVIVVSIFTRKNTVRTATTWDCGIHLSPRMEITSTGFARSIITIFKRILRPTQRIDEEYHDTNFKYFIKNNAITLDIHDVYESYVHKPLRKSIVSVGNFIKKIQSGNENAYILYVFMALIILILNLIFS